jgi:hypothetical protein
MPVVMPGLGFGSGKKVRDKLDSGVMVLPSLRDSGKMVADIPPLKGWAERCLPCGTYSVQDIINDLISRVKS